MDSNTNASIIEPTGEDGRSCTPVPIPEKINPTMTRASSASDGPGSPKLKLVTAPAYTPVPQIVSAKSFVMDVVMAVDRSMATEPVHEVLFSVAEAYEPYRPRTGSLLPALAAALHQIVQHPSYGQMSTMRIFRLAMTLALRVKPHELNEQRLVIVH